MLSATSNQTLRASRAIRRLWVAAAVVAAGYGIFLIVTAIFLIVTALRLPFGAELTGQFTLQPAVKALAACCWRLRR